MDTKVKLNSEVMLIVKAPYNNDFIEGAKRLGGMWNSSKKVWVFDPDNEEDVRDLIEEAFEGEEDYELTL